MDVTSRWPVRLAAFSLKARLPGVFLTAALLFACGNDSVSDEPGSDLRDIDRIEDLKAIFNQNDGVPRLILLLSPT